MQTRGGKRVKGAVTIKPVKKNRKLPEDFLIYSPIGHEEQYRLVQERQQSRNYQEARYQCDMCYRGFRGMQTYNKHMKKHDPVSTRFRFLLFYMPAQLAHTFDPRRLYAEFYQQFLWLELFLNVFESQKLKSK